MRAAIYCRVSTDEQRERESIKAQIECAKMYCERERIEISDWYLDDGVSGSIPFHERAEGRRLLNDAASKCFDFVLVYMIDRFSRNVGQGVTAMETLLESGIHIKSMTEPYNTSDFWGQHLVIDSFNKSQLWKSQYLQRSMDSTVRLVAEGVWMGGICPFGYRVEGRGKRARIEPSEDPMPGLDVSEADIVRMMYHWLADEKRSCYWVCERLTELGVPPAYVSAGREVKKNTRKQATTGIWRPARIRNLIVSTTYKGIHEWGKTSSSGNIIRRPVPRIIDEDTWRRAQATLHENQIMSSANRKHDYLLRGLVRCELCGLNFSGSTSQTKNGEKSYYKCNGR
ncbi:MAG: recombinase family protein, partial [Armatimonadota bacterium]